ncbi:MAG: bifunctional (p)ppGpp synthetase/guanosine-3',5'-bis(diphosphate) 3'-pyrophosphohydrolase [Bacteroidales bacterium]|nr:bifunctional (p)ppGpp synthetase/guanosine-3',5'-bis(diphosphate) 3'-pyrophosphohydrolase [Bacteroidales bacterium]
MTALDTYSPEERAEILRRYRNLIEVWHTRKDVRDRWMVRKAFTLAVEAHKDMRRKTGEPYIYHPIEVATIAAGEIGLGRTSIICALLHDVVEDTEYKIADITAMFGEHIGRIIDGLTKLDIMVEGSDVPSMQAENFRKVLLTLSYDVRVILIKLADRLHNMRTLDAMPQHKQFKIASETLYLFAPLAYRLGLYAIKTELEDLSLKYTEPAVYESISKSLIESRPERNAMIESFLIPIREALNKMKIKYRIRVVENSIYSIWSKTKEKDISFSDYHDTFFVRFIVDAPPETEKISCWQVYAAVTNLYKPNNQLLRDWISLPKANGYESLHCTVMSKAGRWVNLQIRSERMDAIAEKGYAAYWKYKDTSHIEGESESESESESGLDEWLNKVRELLSSDEASALEFMDNFRLNLFSDEIFVFTPKGEMISMPKGSTALDFAFNIHTNLGSKCIGANVNHKLVQLNHELKSGDQVEIITSKVQFPKEEWFSILVTARAKTRLQDAIREYRKTFREEGRKKLEDILQQLNLDPGKPTITRLIEAEGLSGLVDLYYYTATDKINLAKVKEAFRDKSGSASSGFFKYLISPFMRHKPIEEAASQEQGKTANHTMKADVIGEETTDLGYTVATCCNPIPGDDVVALAFPGEPMQIHRVNCPTAIDLMSKYGNNIIKAKWKQEENVTFLAGLKITAIDSIGFIHNLTEIISIQLKINIRNLQIESSNGVVVAYLTIYVQNLQSLQEVITRLKKMEGIRFVKRLERISEMKN